MPPSNEDYTSTEFRTNPYSMVRPVPIHKPHNSICNHNSIAISSIDSSNSESDKKIEPKSNHHSSLRVEWVITRARLNFQQRLQLKGVLSQKGIASTLRIFGCGYAHKILKTLLWFNQLKFNGAYLDWGSGRAAFLWGGEKPNGLHYSALSFAGEFDFS